MGQFAQQSLPLSDSVNLLIQRVNQTYPEVVTVSPFPNHNLQIFKPPPLYEVTLPIEAQLECIQRYCFLAPK